jgi:cAMP-binding proteins - catabolite gene activator and regulatory subunit of cAMP-dependent protein kinases
VQANHVSILDALSEAGRRSLLDRSVEKIYRTGETLWTAGDTPAGLTLVVEGHVRILRATGGRQTIIHAGEAGSTLGEIPFFTRSSYPATAIASEPTRCLLITYEAFEKALASDPQLAFALLKRLSTRVELLVERVSQLSGESVQARLARFILARASRNGNPDASHAFSLGVTQLQLAEELGTVREVVVRALRSLKESGAITSAGDGKYRVGDYSMLKKVGGVEQARRWERE